MNNREFEKRYYNNRKLSNSIKWKVGREKDSLPMWIADMDFRPDERIVKKLNDFITYGDYGYAGLPDDYYDVVLKWNKERHDLKLDKDWIRFSKGAIDGLFQVISAFTKVGDGVMINTPVYHPFARTIKQTKRKVVESKLINTNGYFTFDFADIEDKFKKEKPKAIILCSPHNPVGRVWKKGELEELLYLCHKYHVLVISDEVHNDIIMPDQQFIPTLSFKKYQDEIVVFTAVSKTFSFPIYAHCHVIIPSAKLRGKFDAYQKDQHRDSVSGFDCLPTYYGYMYGSEWIDQVNNIVFENYNYFKDKLGKYFEITPLEGSYLIFVNIGKYNKDKSAANYLINQCHIVTNAGEAFGKGYNNWVRINLATSLANVKKAVKELEKITK